MNATFNPLVKMYIECKYCKSHIWAYSTDGCLLEIIYHLHEKHKDESK